MLWLTSVHFTETCDPGLPHLITCVQTTDASETNMQQTQLVHEELARRELLPQTHIVDAGYVDAGAIVESREQYGIELVRPVSKNNQWQAKAGKDRSAWSPQSAHPLRSENLSRVPLPIIVYSRPKQTQTSDNTLKRGISSVATDSEASRNRSIPHHVCHEVRY